jgi:hypothetical protein
MLIKLKLQFQNWLFKQTRKGINKSEGIKFYILYNSINNILSNTKVYTLKIESLNKIRKNHEVINSNKKLFNYGHRISRDAAPKEEKKNIKIGYKYLQNQIINVNNNITVDLKSKIAYYQESWNMSRNKVINLDGGHVLTNNGEIIIAKIHKKIEVVEKGTSLYGYWYKNWYHWLVEIAGKYSIIHRLPDELKKYPLIIPKLVKESNHYQLIKILFKEFELVELDDNKSYKIKDLIVIDSAVNQPPNYRYSTTQELYEDNLLESDLFKDYVKELQIKILSQNPNIITYKKIFLARKQNRRAYNQQEIENMLTKLGFQTIYLEDYDLAGQARLMHEAEFIVGPTGAAWANMLFCKQNTKCVLWTPECTKNMVTYSNIAENINLNIRFVYFETGTKSWREFMSKGGEYNLKIEELNKALLSLENSN